MTWIRDLPLYIKYFHVIGDPLMKELFSFNNEENILYVKTNDDYISLPSKVITAYEAVLNTYKVKYILKTDDDQKLLNNTFFYMVRSAVEQILPKVNYGGFVINVKKPYISEYYKIHPELPKNLQILAIKYCSGRFYLLSELAAKSLVMQKEEISKEYLEDYAVGLYLPNILKENILNINTSNFFKDF